MATIGQVANYVRSKGAGPFWVTIDIFCETEEAYNKIKNSKNVTAKTIAETYNLDEKDIRSFYMPNILAIKFSYPRGKKIQGHKYESDMHSGQQYVLLTDIEI